MQVLILSNKECFYKGAATNEVGKEKQRGKGFENSFEAHRSFFCSKLMVALSLSSIKGRFLVEKLQRAKQSKPGKVTLKRKGGKDGKAMCYLKAKGVMGVSLRAPLWVSLQICFICQAYRGGG